MGTAVAKRKSGEIVPQGIRDKIVFMLLSGEFPTDAEIARTVGVSPSFVTKMLKNDPELAEKRKEAEREMAQQIERSAVQLALTGRNEIARQKSQEMLLKKLYSDRYGDDAENTSTEKGSRKVIINLNLPVTKTDENGIPICQSDNPLMDALDVEPHSTN